MFYTPSTLTVSHGDRVEGTITCAPNARNNRDLDIGITYRAPGSDFVSIQYKMCVDYLSLSSSSPFCVCGILRRIER